MTPERLRRAAYLMRLHAMKLHNVWCGETGRWHDDGTAKHEHRELTELAVALDEEATAKERAVANNPPRRRRSRRTA